MMLKIYLKIRLNTRTQKGIQGTNEGFGSDESLTKQKRKNRKKKKYWVKKKDLKENKRKVVKYWVIN